MLFAARGDHHFSRHYVKSEMTTLIKFCAGLMAFVWMCTSALHADWSCRPDVAVPVSTNSGNQWNVHVAGDGLNGSILVWQDRRSGSEDKLFVQRISSSGNPLWQSGGLAIASTAGFQYYPQILADGAGGAFIVWQDNRYGLDYDIFIQRINSAGLSLWTPNGVLLCNASGHQYNPQIISDGAGGVIATWQDKRDGNYDIYAQRLNGLGQAQWTINGLAVCKAPSDQLEPKLTPDAQNGAIIAWIDYRAGTGFSDIYSQRILANGQPAWTPDGVVICGATNTQWNVQVVQDGAGSAIIIWQDRRSGTYDNIYAQRVDNVGRPRWADNGIAIAPALGIQYYPQAASDGAGGAMVTWQDNRRGADYDIYSQRVTRDGALLWGATGKPVCTAPGHQYNPQIVAQGSSAVIAWQDRRGADFNICAQRLDLGGQTQWIADGIEVCNPPLDQFLPQLAGDGFEGAIIAWPDYQQGAGSTDIFIQRVGANGRVGGGCYRSFSQYGFAKKPVRYRSRLLGTYAMPSEGNVADTIFGRGMFPNGIYVGVERLDSAKRYGWELFTKPFYIRHAMPQNGVPRPFDRVYEKFFVGLKKNPSLFRYNNALSAELLTLKLNIAASDLGITEKGLGDLVFIDSTKRSNPMNNLTLRQIAGYGDSILTFWRTRPANYFSVYFWLNKINNTFVAPFDTISTIPLRIRPASTLFSASYLVPGTAPPPVIPISQPDAAVSGDLEQPDAFELDQNYPNPFNPVTTIEFTLPEPSKVTLKVYDILGREAALLLDNTVMDEGHQLVDFDASHLASGVYFYQLYAADVADAHKPLSLVKKMILLK